LSICEKDEPIPITVCSMDEIGLYIA
jgi:hypothetical protein